MYEFIPYLSCRIDTCNFSNSIFNHMYFLKILLKVLFNFFFGGSVPCIGVFFHHDGSIQIRLFFNFFLSLQNNVFRENIHWLLRITKILYIAIYTPHKNYQDFLQKVQIFYIEIAFCRTYIFVEDVRLVAGSSFFK